MSDPRFTDPRYGNSQLSEPVLRRDDSVGGTWGWVAGLAVIALIALFLIAGGKGVNNNTAVNSPPPIGTTGSASMRNVTPGPSTTGSGTTSPQPVAPSALAPKPPGSTN